MAFNIFSTLNQNLQNFWGDLYDTYQAWKSKVGNVASTINTNLQNFWGDIYDVGSTIKKNVSNFWTQTYNQGKQAVNQIQSNVSQFGTDVANKASAVKKSILAPADRFMTDVTKIGNARKATQYGISEKDKSALMNQMLDAGQYSDDEIIQAVAQLDAEEKARKQKEFADWQAGNKANANIGQKALAGALNLWGGAIAGIGQGTLGIADFATGGKIDALKQEKQAYDEAIANNQWAFTVGKNIGQIGASFAAPWLGKLAPTWTSLAATAGRGAVYGGIYGAANPIMEKWSEATASDIWYDALWGATTGAIAGPLLEKVVSPAIGKTIQSATSGINAAKFAQGSLVDKAKAWIQATGKNIARGIKSIPTGWETLTRNIPRAIVKRDLGFTPTQRAKIENITGGDEAQYILKKWLAGKPKEELAQIFMKQADDAYNGITTKLANIDKTVKSNHADEALQDILDQLNSSPKIQRAYAKDIAWVENMLKKGEYTLSELNNIRRAYDKVNTGMFTVQWKARSGLENEIDVKVRRWLSDQLQKEAKKFGVDVKWMNTELRAWLEMKDALLSRLSQEERNNFLWLQDLGVSAILSGGEPVSAVATIAAKKYAEKVAPWLAQKAYNLNKNPNVTRRVSRGNTITPRNKSSGLGLASSTSNPMVSDSVKPPIVPKAKPKATTESALKTTPVVPEKKSIVAKKEVSTIPITDVKKEPKFIRNGWLTDDNGIYKDHRYKNEVYKKEFIANSDIDGTVIKKWDRVAISEESWSKWKRYVAILQKWVKDENWFYITSEPNIKLSNFYKDNSTPKESAPKAKQKATNKK